MAFLSQPHLPAKYANKLISRLQMMRITKSVSSPGWAKGKIVNKGFKILRVEPRILR